MNKFAFTITDLALFLGKSPVTIRGWEKKGVVTLAREGTDRRLTAEQVEEVAQVAFDLGRISQNRLRLVNATVTLINLIERENG